MSDDAQQSFDDVEDTKDLLDRFARSERQFNHRKAMIENGLSGEFPAPREFQTRTLEKLRTGWREGHRTQLIMAPTGSGKTYLGLYLISEALKKGKKALFICDRRTLIEQTSSTADRYGLVEHGVIQADHWRRNTANFQICSAQTLAKRGMPQADLLVIDEAHTQMKAWTNHVPNTKAAVIGLSATPFSKGLGKLFSNVVVAETMHKLTEDGILVPMKVLTGRMITHVNMEGAATKSNGEWTDEAQTERGLEIIGDVVTEWTKHAYNLKTIVFGATIKHCEAMAAQFNSAGIWAAAFTERTTDTDREELLREFRKPDAILKVLISVQALAKGFDVPDVECVCDVRPMRKSLSEVVQMWGRGLRSHPGKTECKILDFSGNRVRFNDDFEQFYYEGIDRLDDGETLDKKIRKDEPKEAKPCPRCGASPFGKRCVACGYVRRQAETKEHHPGELIAFEVGKHRVERKDLWLHCLTLAKRKGKTDTAEGWASHLYKSIAGTWPPSNRLRAGDLLPEVGDINPAVMAAEQRNRIAYAKSRARAS